MEKSWNIHGPISHWGCWLHAGDSEGSLVKWIATRLAYCLVINWILTVAFPHQSKSHIYIYICVHVCEICVILIESLDVSRSNPFPPVLSTRALVKCWICSFWRPIWGALNGVIDISLYLSISHSLSLCIYIYTCLSIDLSLSLSRAIYLSILYYIILCCLILILF